MAPLFWGIAYFFRPAALVAGALAVHERAELRERQARALRRARIFGALLLAVGATCAVALLLW